MERELSWGALELASVERELSWEVLELSSVEQEPSSGVQGRQSVERELSLGAMEQTSEPVVHPSETQVLPSDKYRSCSLRRKFHCIDGTFEKANPSSTTFDLPLLPIDW